MTSFCYQIKFSYFFRKTSYCLTLNDYIFKRNYSILNFDSNLNHSLNIFSYKIIRLVNWEHHFWSNVHAWAHCATDHQGGEGRACYCAECDSLPPWTSVRTHGSIHMDLTTEGPELCPWVVWWTLKCPE